MSRPSLNTNRVALFLYSLDGGGAERVMANLAVDFADKGLDVDLVLVRAKGPYLSLLPPQVRVIPLKAGETAKCVPDLVRYLRRERPAVLLSTMHFANEVALIAKLLARTGTKVIVCEQNHLSRYAQNTSRKVERWTPLTAKLLYRFADGIVVASKGVGQDLSQVTGLPPKKIRVIYNPVITSELDAQAKVPVDHPWFAHGEPPVILGVGRLVGQKDFHTLIRAFALVRQSLPARLMILGDNAGSRPSLEALIQELRLQAEVALPGFAANPYAYMAQAKVFVLSSRWEGFGNVIVEALAAGTPVVSTNCESGPAEILDRGRYGALVPVGDPEAMAAAIVQVLSGQGRPIDPQWLSQFSLSTVAQQYLEVLGLAARESEGRG